MVGQRARRGRDGTRDACELTGLADVPPGQHESGARTAQEGSFATASVSDTFAIADGTTARAAMSHHFAMPDSEALEMQIRQQRRGRPSRRPGSYHQGGQYLEASGNAKGRARAQAPFTWCPDGVATLRQDHPGAINHGCETRRTPVSHSTAASSCRRHFTWQRPNIARPVCALHG